MNLCRFDENGDPVMLLAINREKFLSICDKFPESKRVMLEKAQKRRKQFKIVSYSILDFLRTKSNH